MHRAHLLKSVIHSYIGSVVSKVQTSQPLISAMSPRPTEPRPGNAGPGDGKKAAAAKVTHHKPGGHKIYKMLALFVCVPIIGLLAINTFVLNAEDHNAPHPEFHAYDYLGKRDKRYPWGDGTKTLFFNPKVNFTKDGYEGDDGGHQEAEDEE